MKSLRAKLLLTIITIVVLSNLVLTYTASYLSKKEMNKSVQSNLDAVAARAADVIAAANEKEFRMLHAVAVLPFIKSTGISLQEKCDQLRQIAAINPAYTNVAYYTKDGMSYTHEGQLVDFSGRDYFKGAITGSDCIMDPYISSVNNMLTMTYSVPVYDDSKQICGVVCSILSGENMSTVAASMGVGKKDHPSITNRKTGMIVGEADPESVKNKKNIKDANMPGLKELLEKACNGETGGGGFYDTAQKQWMTAAFRPVPNCDWIVFCAAPRSDFFSGLDTMVRIMMVTCASSILIAVLYCGFVITVTIKPLKIVDKSIGEIASGDADLTQRIQVKSKDEIGHVVKGFNAFSEKLQSIITEIKKSKTVLTTAGEDLQASTDDTASSITQIIANIESVRNQITNQSASVEETAGAVNEIASNIASLEKMIENQSSGVTQASAAVEEMIGNIGSVNQSVEKMADSFDELQQNAKNGSDKQQDVNERIEQIESQSEMLQEANTAIANIASQTNLLAMNAAIEAAHAGEAGKGFSVVADEIRKLSETSTTQSKTIGDQLNKIKESINSVVSASAESSSAFVSVSDKIKETDDLVRQIKAAMEEQTEGSKQISDALHSMNDSTMEVKSASSEMSAGNQAILEEVKRLQDATTVMKDSMTEMSVGARKINETGAALKDISSKMKSSITDIGDQIDQFKV